MQSTWWAASTQSHYFADYKQAAVRGLEVFVLTRTRHARLQLFVLTRNLHAHLELCLSKCKGIFGYFSSVSMQPRAENGFLAVGHLWRTCSHMIEAWYTKRYCSNVWTCRCVQQVCLGDCERAKAYLTRL